MKPSPPVIRTVLFCHHAEPFASIPGCPLGDLMTSAVGIVSPALKINLPYHGRFGVSVIQGTWVLAIQAQRLLARRAAGALLPIP